MSNIIEALKKAPGYIGGTGRTDEEIRNAEELLGVEFASDYRYYLKEIGLACFDGHELTGICESTRLNVVNVTLKERALFLECSDWYVIEQASIDGIIIWQAPTGEIFQSAPGVPGKRSHNSLIEFILDL